jgi:hypothetical protein
VAKDLRRAKQTLHSALEAGLQIRDYVLIAEAIYWLTVVTVLKGDSKAARNLTRFGMDLEATVKTSELSARFRLANGNVLLHEGNPSEALAAYASANILESRRLQYAQTEGLLAFFELCGGKVSDGVKRLETPRQIANETGHVSLQSLTVLADGYLALQMREWDIALKEFGKICLAGGHYGIYAQEGNACALAHLGYRFEAEEQLLTAQAQRRRIHMVYTQWDKSRMRFIPSSTLSLDSRFSGAGPARAT